MDRHSSEDKDESTTEDEHRGSDGPRYLYRSCRQEEDPDRGLFARDPAATHVTPKSHVYGNRVSPYISTCSTLEAVQRYIGLAVVNNGFRPGPVVRIDLARLRRSPGVEIIDLSNPDVFNREFLPTDARGRNYNVVLVKGGIPADCIKVLEHVEESDKFDKDDYSSEYNEEDFEESSEGQGQSQRGEQDEHSNTDDDTMEDDHSSERTKRRKRQDEETFIKNTNSSERGLMAKTEDILKDDQEEARKLKEAGTASQYTDDVASVNAKVTADFIPSSVAKAFFMQLLGIGSLDIGSKVSKDVEMERIAKGASVVLFVAFVSLTVWQIVSSANEQSEDNSKEE